MSHSNCDQRREHEQAGAHEPQEQLFAPISRIHLREKQQAFVNQISKASRSDQHEQANAGPCKHHYHVNQHEAKKPAHILFKASSLFMKKS